MADTADPAARLAARLFVAATVQHLNDGPLVDALRETYGDAYVTGLMVGAQQTQASVITPLGVDAPADWNTYWDGWKPGSQPAAALLEQGGLAKLLDDAGITIKGIVGSTLDGLGNVLADGVAQGLGVDEIARNMGDWLDNPDRAWLIADTESARAMHEASMDSYVTAGIVELDWLVSPGACPTCQDYADNGPYRVDNFPGLPAHPRCRCSSAPRDPGPAQ